MEILNLPILGFKHELNHYTAEILTPAQYHHNLNNDLTVTAEVENDPRRENTGNFSKPESISGKRSIMLNFSVDMYYLTEMNVPDYFELLESCGWRKIYTPLDVLIIENDEDSVNIEINTDDGIHIFRVAVENVIMSQSHRNNRRPSTISCIYPEFGLSPKQLEYLASGAMGTIEFTGSVGQPIKLTFSFLGCLDNIKTRQYEDLIIPSGFTETLPKQFMNSTVLIAGESVEIVDFRVVCGNILSLFSNITSKSGYDGSRITDKISTGTITINSNIDNITTFLKYINEETVFSIRNGRILLQFEGVQFNSMSEDFTKWSFDVHNKIVIAQEDV